MEERTESEEQWPWRRALRSTLRRGKRLKEGEGRAAPVRRGPAGRLLPALVRPRPHDRSERLPAAHRRRRSIDLGPDLLLVPENARRERSAVDGRSAVRVWGGGRAGDDLQRPEPELLRTHEQTRECRLEFPSE